MPENPDNGASCRAVDVSQSQAAARVQLGHVPALDGLRGIAILLVLWYHSAVIFGDAFGPGPLRFYCRLGYSGVDLFFVLSGFLITSILLESRGKANYFVSFFARRGLRIWPLYFVVMTLMFGLLGPLVLRDMAEGYAQWHDTWPWTFLFLTNVQLAARGGWLLSISDVTWSVCIEEQFYLIWPCVVLALGRRGLWVCLPGLIVAAIGARLWLAQSNDNAWFVAYLLPHTRADALAAGALVALVYGSRGMSDTRITTPKMIMWLVISAVLVSLPGMVHGTLKVATAFTAFAAGYGILLCITLYGGDTPWRSVLSWSVLRYIGKISYGIYMFHLIVGHAVRVGLEGRIDNPVVYYLIGSLAMLLGTLALAGVSWHVFERQILKLKCVFPRPSDEAACRHWPGDLAQHATMTDRPQACEE